MYDSAAKPPPGRTGSRHPHRTERGDGLKGIFLICAHAYAQRINQVLHLYAHHFAVVAFTHIKRGWQEYLPKHAAGSDYTLIGKGLMLLHRNASDYEERRATDFYAQHDKLHLWPPKFRDVFRGDPAFLETTAQYVETAKVFADLLRQPAAPWVEVLASSVSMKPLDFAATVDGVLYAHADVWLSPSRLRFQLRCSAQEAPLPLLPERHWADPYVSLPCSIDTHSECQRWAWHVSDSSAQSEQGPPCGPAISRRAGQPLAERFCRPKPGMGSWSWPGVLAATCSSVLDGALEASYPRTTSDGKCKRLHLPSRQGWVDFYYLPRAFWSGYVTLARHMQRFGAFHEWAEPTMLELLAGAQSGPATLCGQLEGGEEDTCWGGCCGTLGLVRPHREMAAFMSNYTTGHRIDLEAEWARDALTEVLQRQTPFPYERPLRCHVRAGARPSAFSEGAVEKI